MSDAAMKLVVVGAAGRMGQTLIRLIHSIEGVRLHAAVERAGSPFVGLFELATGIAVLVGFQVRIVGWLLAVFCVFTGLVFHLAPVNVPDFPAAANGWINGLNFVNLMKNITLAGAYIMLATNGAGAYSLDARRGAYAAA